MIKIEEKLLDAIEIRAIQKVYIDLSGAFILNPEIIGFLLRIIKGINLLGCQVALTGISSKSARFILNTGEQLLERVSIHGTLQQALLRESTGIAAI